MKSLFQRPVIFATKYNSGTLLAINSRHVNINAVNGMLKTGLGVYKDTSKFKRVDIDHLLTVKTLPDKFRYDIEMVSVNSTSILYTTNKTGHTEHKLVDCITIPNYIKFIDLIDTVDTDRHRALALAKMIIDDPNYITVYS